MARMFGRRKPHREHTFTEQRIGAGLTRRVCTRCREDHLERRSWPILRWLVRGDGPELFGRRAED